MLDLKLLRQKASKLELEYQHARKTLKEEKKNLAGAEEHLTSCQEAQTLLQGVAEKVQQQAHGKIAGVVSRCLKAVFGEDAYTFQIDFSRKRGRTEAQLSFAREGELYSPQEEAGGGVVDLASFALRLACLVLSRPRKRKLLCLDEPAKMLSREYHALFKGLLELLASEMDLQIIMTTHSPGMVTGKVYEL